MKVMSPLSTRTSTQENKDKDKHRVRKPAVEKMRRDRINTGIERLKVLLKDELKPKSKLEKADILETAVAYLKKSKAVARAPPEQCYADGFARCLEETARFLLAAHHRVPTGQKHVLASSLTHALLPKATGGIGVSVNDVKSSSERTGAVWRPW